MALSSHLAISLQVSMLSKVLVIFGFATFQPGIKLYQAFGCPCPCKPHIAFGVCKLQCMAVEPLMLLIGQWDLSLRFQIGKVVLLRWLNLSANRSLALFVGMLCIQQLVK